MVYTVYQIKYTAGSYRPQHQHRKRAGYCEEWEEQRNKQVQGVFPKGWKKWVTKPVMDKKSYSFVQNLMKDVLSKGVKQHQQCLQEFQRTLYQHPGQVKMR